MRTARPHVAGGTGGGAFALPEPPHAAQGASVRRVPPQALHVGISPAPAQPGHGATPLPEQIVHARNPRPEQPLQRVRSDRVTCPDPLQTEQGTVVRTTFP